MPRFLQFLGSIPLKMTSIVVLSKICHILGTGYSIYMYVHEKFCYWKIRLAQQAVNVAFGRMLSCAIYITHCWFLVQISPLQISAENQCPNKPIKTEETRLQNIHIACHLPINNIHTVLSIHTRTKRRQNILREYHLWPETRRRCLRVPVTFCQPVCFLSTLLVISHEYDILSYFQQHVYFNFPCFFRYSHPVVGKLHC